MVKSLSKIRAILLIACLLFGHKFAIAQTLVYSYEQMENLLLRQNPGLLAAKERVEAATHILQATGPKYWPRLTFYYRYFPEGIAFQEGEIATKNWLSARLTFDLIRYFSVRTYRKQEKQANVALEEIAVQKLQREALFAFRKLYVQTLNSKIQAGLYSKLCSTSVKILDVRRIQLENQEALRKHLLAAQIEVKKYRSGLEKFQREYQMGKKKLAIALRMPDALFELKKEFYIPFVPQQELLMQSALDKHLQSRESLFFIQRELARSRAIPAEDLNFEPYIGYRLRELHRGTLEAGPEFGLKIGFGLGYFSQRKQQNAYFAATRRAIRLDEENARMNVVFTLNATYRELQSLKKMIQQKNEELNLLLEKLRIEKAIASQGIEGIGATPVALLELRVAKIRLETEAANFKSDYMQRYFELMNLAGISWEEVLQFHRDSADKNPEARSRALWVWDTPSILLGAGAADSLIAICTAGKIGKVFLSFPGDLRKTLFANRNFRQLLVKLRHSKISVSALLGDPHWIFPRNRENLLQKIRAIIAFQKRYASAKLITSMHLDIEPQALAGWQNRKRDYFQYYLESIESVRNVMLDAGTALQLEIDIPLQFGQFASNLRKKLISNTSALTIMAYGRNESRKIIAAVADLIISARQAKKKYRIGLNCKDFANLSEFENMIHELDHQFLNDDLYDGVAVHNFATWMKLNEKP